MESKRITKHLDRLLLDPNNYRFIDNIDYRPVPDEQIADNRIQSRTQSLLTGKNNDNIRDLISSFTTNGFLDIDQIQVKAIGDKYIVLEGNRRTATLKYLYDEFKKGNDVGVLTEADFRSVTIVEIVGEDQVQHLITMGLHHISGKKRWSAVNEAQLVSDLMFKFQKNEEEICNSLGITKYKLRKSVRTLSLINQYKASDYGDQFKTDMYSIFEAVVGTPAMKEWIGWDDYKYEATNTNNIERFFSWISKTEDVERNEVQVEQVVIREAIITQYRQIRELAEFVNDNKAIKRMEESRSIAEGFAYSEVIAETRLKNALSNIRSEVQVAFNFSEHMTDLDYQEINKLKNKLDKLLPTNQDLIIISEKTTAKYFQTVNTHFSYLNIISYRKLINVQIKNLSRINFFVGANNMGKTSVIEAVYMLSQQNNVNAFFDLEKYRGKFYNGFTSKWLDNNLGNSIEIEGKFNTYESSLLIQKEEAVEDIDKTGYLSTIKVDAKINGIELDSSIHLYDNREPELRYTKSQILCQGALTSPYRYNMELLRKAHIYSVEERYFDEIVNFIRLHIDKEIEKIEMVNDKGESRFMVTSNTLDKAIDITKYGEGVQRVFEIALLMIYCNNGILCIDEIDCALHKSLLVDFSKFIQQLAERFNIQVFMTTHSKECIDAFIKAKHNENKDITAYSLAEEEGSIVCKYISGERLEVLIDTLNFDIR